MQNKNVEKKKESRPLASSNTGSLGFTDFPSLCACSGSSPTNLIGSGLNLLCLQSHSEPESNWTYREVVILCADQQKRGLWRRELPFISGLRHDSRYWIEFASCDLHARANFKWSENQHWDHAAGMSRVERWDAFPASSSVCSHASQSLIPRTSASAAVCPLELKCSATGIKLVITYYLNKVTYHLLPNARG